MTRLLEDKRRLSTEPAAPSTAQWPRHLRWRGHTFSSQVERSRHSNAPPGGSPTREARAGGPARCAGRSGDRSAPRPRRSANRTHRRLLQRRRLQRSPASAARRAAVATVESISLTLAAEAGPMGVRVLVRLDEKRCRGGEVVDHDADVLHALDRHTLDGGSAALARAAWRTRWSRSATVVARRAASA